MSKLLDEIIKFRKQNAIDYEAYLQKIADLAKQEMTGKADNTPPSLITKAKRALYNNLGRNEFMALQIDAAVLISKSDGLRGNQAKEYQIKKSICKIVNEWERIFAIVKHQNDY